jgi:hypothetical protein
MSASDSDAATGDGIFALSEDLVQLPTYKAATTQSVDFDGILDPPLLLHEDLARGCGGQLWPAGMRLAKYLLRTKRDELKNSASMFVQLAILSSLSAASADRLPAAWSLELEADW